MLKWFRRPPRPKDYAKDSIAALVAQRKEELAAAGTWSASYRCRACAQVFQAGSDLTMGEARKALYEIRYWNSDRERHVDSGPVIHNCSTARTGLADLIGVEQVSAPTTHGQNQADRGGSQIQPSAGHPEPGPNQERAGNY